MKEKYFPQLNNAKQRAEFFPVEWRSAIKLDGDIVEAITPQKLVTLRQLLNSTAMDIMYYTSPLYRAEVYILKSVSAFGLGGQSKINN